MKEFIGAMGIAFWTEHSGDYKLSFRKPCSEHMHERDASSRTKMHSFLAEVGLRGIIQ